MTNKTNKESASVFEVYASEYDLITNAAAREKPHGREIDALVAAFKPRTALDAGCAVGLTTRLLAERGVKTVGYDCSGAMLREARRKMAGLNLPLTFRRGYFEKMPGSFLAKFDMVACLANSISGVGSLTNLTKALRNFKRVLRPDGTLVLQMLNYESIDDGVIFPIKCTENNGVVYERFSERRGKDLYIYVTRAEISEVSPRLEIFRHKFGNFSPAAVIKTLRKVGFTQVGKHGNLLLTKPFDRDCRDLILVAS
jgi:ubiquinone/menaquinone biosynthesis C-methylase UbiE